MTVRLRGNRFMLDIRHERPDGTVDRIRIAVPEDKQTRRGAEAHERLVLADLRAGLDPRRRTEQPQPMPAPKREVPTLRKFADTFLNIYANTNNRPSTAREKRRCLGRAILPALGDLRLDRIGPREIEAYKASRLASKTVMGRKPANKTVNEELAILAKILRVAQEWGEIASVPAIKRLKVPPSSFDFLDEGELERLLAAAKTAEDPWCTMIPIACLTGLRLGELRGLEQDHVDLVARRIHVRQAADDQGEIHPPKSGKARVVDLPQRAVEILKAHRHLRGPFVFCREDGSMLQHWHCESRERRGDSGPLSRVCKRAGLRSISWHDLRHTYASHLVMRGATLQEVQELLGHASITMTMRYAHLSPARRRAAVDLLDRPAGSGDRGHSLGTVDDSKSGSSR